jgi:hypothetical protein
MILSAYLSQANWLSIIAAGIAYFLLGWLWFSPLLFAKAWGSLQQRDLSTVDRKDALRSMAASFIVTFAVVIAVDLFCFALGASTALGGLKVGLALALGLMAATYAISFAYSGKKWALYLIETGYQACAIVLSAVILAVWR